MKIIDALEKFDLISWETLFFGFRKNFVEQSEIIKYAEQELMENYDDYLALIAGADHLNQEDFKDLLEKYVKILDLKENEELIIKKWRLADLYLLEQEKISPEDKLKKLQYIYAKYNYPIDMKDCDIYSPGNYPPIQAMKDVIEKLKNELKVK